MGIHDHDAWPNSGAMDEWNRCQDYPICCPRHMAPTTAMVTISGEPGSWLCPRCGFTTPVTSRQALAALASVGDVAAATSGDIIIPSDTEADPRRPVYLGTPIPVGSKSGQSIGGADTAPLLWAIAFGAAVVLAVAVVVGSMTLGMFAGVIGSFLWYAIFCKPTATLSGRLEPTVAENVEPGVWVLVDDDGEPWRKSTKRATAWHVVSVWRTAVWNIRVECSGGKFWEGPDSTTFHQAKPAPDSLLPSDTWRKPWQRGDA